MNSSKIDPILNEMLYRLEKAPKIYRPSLYWRKINSFHINHLSIYGITDFKRSLNREYFEWGLSAFRFQLTPFLSELKKGNVYPIFKSKLTAGATYTVGPRPLSMLTAYVLRIKSKGLVTIRENWLRPLDSLEFLVRHIYKIHIAYLYDYIQKIDKKKLLKKLSEPNVGSPLLVGTRGNLISQDLCNSVHEFYSITEAVGTDRELEIIELGAGYGRLAYVFLKALPKASYCIVDIPPALFVAQTYLSKLFPKLKIFSFRHFSSFKKVEEEFKKSRIKFLLPHQIELIPKDYFDIAINISSLHEMRTDQIRNYINQINRVTKGYFYSKQWKKSRAQDNNYIREKEYPLPKNFTTIYHRTHPIQNLFFEAIYKTRKN